jgi:hypothetical protein
MRARRLLLLASAAIAALLWSVLGAAPANAMCRPGSVRVLPKPQIELPRCDTFPQ